MVNHVSTYLYDVLERLIAFDTVSSHSDVSAMEHLAARFAAIPGVVAAGQDWLGFLACAEQRSMARTRLG